MHDEPPPPPPEDWTKNAERAFEIIEKAPEHYRWLCTPILIQALSDVRLRPFIDLITTDPFFKHLLAGGKPSPFI